MKRILNCGNNNSLFIHNKFISHIRTNSSNMNKNIVFQIFTKISPVIEMKWILYCVKNNSLSTNKKIINQLRINSFSQEKKVFLQFSRRPFQKSKLNNFWTAWKIIFYPSITNSYANSGLFCSVWKKLPFLRFFSKTSIDI